MNEIIKREEKKIPSTNNPNPFPYGLRMNERTEPRYAVLANTSGDQTPRTKREKKNRTELNKAEGESAEQVIFRIQIKIAPFKLKGNKSL